MVHPGSHADPLRGTQLVAEAIAELHRRVPKGESKLLLENTAGQGTALGFRLDGLGALVMATDHLGTWAKKRVGICLDTCHLFAAGYDLSSGKGYEATLQEVDERIGLERVHAFHLNDSKGPLGCRLDRHENIRTRGGSATRKLRSSGQRSPLRRHPGFFSRPRMVVNKSGIS